MPNSVSVLGRESPWPKDQFNDEEYPEPLEVATAAAVTVIRKIAEQLHRGPLFRRGGRHNTIIQ